MVLTNERTGGPGGGWYPQSQGIPAPPVRGPTQGKTHPEPDRMLMPYSGGVSTVSTSSMSHSMSNLKSQFMETDAWSSFLSEGLYDEDSSGSGDFSPSQTLPDSSDGEQNTRKIRRKHLGHHKVSFNILQLKICDSNFTIKLVILILRPQ